jgi:Tol biopolymer transport system component
MMGPVPKIPASLSRDGKWLAYFEIHDGRNQIWTRPMPQGEPRRFVASEEFNYSQPAFSPDGRWMAYVSDESGAQEVHVQPFPGPGMKLRILTDGGTGPVWNPNGRELFYTAPAAKGKSKMMLVDIPLGSALNYGTPTFRGSWRRESTEVFVRLC